MFSTVQYYVNTSLIFLVVGVLSGLFMSLAGNALEIGYGAELVSARTHIILVGSVIMMIMGVALWFFPRPRPDDKRYNPDLIRITYWAMTIGTAARFILQCTAAYAEVTGVRWGTTAASTVQVLAMVPFFTRSGDASAQSEALIEKQRGRSFERRFHERVGIARP